MPTDSLTRLAMPSSRNGRRSPWFEEIGRTGLKEFSGRIAEEPLHRLRGELGRRVYNEMRLNDATVGALLYAITMVLRGVPWHVEPATDDAEGEERALYVESVLNDMSHSWESFVSECLTFLPFGWSFFEVVYKLRQGEKDLPGESSKFDDGLIGVRKLAIRGQDTLDAWVLDESGGVQAMKQRNAKQPIPIEKALLFRFTHEKNNPEGLSILRTAWRSWYFKKKLQEIEAIGAERDLVGYPVAYLDADVITSDDADDIAIENRLKEIVTNMRRDEIEGLVMPLDYFRDSEGRMTENRRMFIELIKSGGSRQFDIDPIIARYDRDILRAGLADFLLFGGGDSSGNRALGETRMGLFQKASNATLDEIEGVLNRHLVPRLAKLNGWTGEMPTLKHGPVEEIDIEAATEMLKNMALGGAEIFPSKNNELENRMLEAAGLPPVPVE